MLWAQKDSADIQKGIAQIKKSLAENNKIEADKQRKIATRQNILTAPNEYARLIRKYQRRPLRLVRILLITNSLRTVITWTTWNH